MKNIIKQLNNIRDGKSISLETFLKNSGLSENIITQIFDIKNDKKGKAFFTIIDSSKYDYYFSKYYQNSNNTKVKEALHGDSHKGKNKDGFILIKEDYNSINGVALYFNFDQYHITFKKKTKLIIIENLSSFCNIVDLFHLSDLNLNDYNFAFSNGNNITKEDFKLFFNEYDEIICAFDYDLDGLKFFYNIQKKHNNVSFYIPDNFDFLLEKYGKNLIEKEYESLIISYKNDIISQHLIKHKKKLEQEILQHRHMD